MKNRDPKRWAALSYSVGLVSGVIVLSVEKPTVPVVGDWGLMPLLGDLAANLSS